MKINQAIIIVKDNTPTYVEVVPTSNICQEEDILTHYSFTAYIDFHPIANHHKPNSHIIILKILAFI